MMMENRLMTNSTEIMTRLLRRSFVVNRRILPADITNELVVDTISGEKLRFNIYNSVYEMLLVTFYYWFTDIFPLFFRLLQLMALSWQKSLK